MKHLTDCKILLVDDTKYNIEILVNALSNECQISVALNGQKAIELVDLNPPDLILLDIMMPVMDGFEACRRIKSNQKSKDIPIIFISAMNEPKHITKGFEMGAVDYVTKPFNIAEVKARVKTHLLLKITKDELKKQNVILEEKVNARTIDLLETNKKLRNEINERRLVQDKLIRSKCLIATGQLAVSVAHEINSPLQGVTSLLNFMKKGHEDDSSLNANIDLVNKAFARIRDTVQKLFDLNRPGKERKQPLNINNVLEDTIALLNSLLKKKNVRIQVDPYPDIPNIIASPQQMGQVFMNLINNSVEAMERGETNGNPALDTSKEIMITTALKDETISISVADTGPGISEQDMAHIFDPFYTRKKKMGMGVGLSICHGIIEDHQGTISVENLDQGGALFQITLPVNTSSDLKKTY